MSAERMTVAEFKGIKKPARQKYRNTPVMVCSECGVSRAPEANVIRCHLCRALLVRFDSKAEAARWAELRRQERLGLIRNLSRQVRFALHAPNGNPIKIRSKGYPNGRLAVYVADYCFDELVDGEWVSRIGDEKGMDTALSRHKRAHVEAEYGIAVLVTRKARAA